MRSLEGTAPGSVDENGADMAGPIAPKLSELGAKDSLLWELDPLPRPPQGRVTQKNVTVNVGALLEERAPPKQRHDAVVKRGLNLCHLLGGSSHLLSPNLGAPGPGNGQPLFPPPRVYHTSHSCPGFMEEPTGQPKCRRKSRELERVPSTRKRAGLWGSVTSPS